MTTRRTRTVGLGLAVLVALAGCGGQASQTGTGTTSAGTTTTAAQEPVELRFTWWGNAVRNQMTQKVIDDFQAKNPNIKIQAEPGEWASYWDKLATQVAGGGAPDIIQQDEQYLRDYSSRGVLADLSKLNIKTDKFAPGLVASGTIDGKVTALTIGVNALSILINPKVFEAAGVPIPDDKTWTWDSLRSVAAEITAKSPKGTYGINAGLFNDSSARAFMFQNNKALFTDKGLGWEPADMQKFFELEKTYLDAKAIPPAADNAEDLNKALEQNMFATGKLGMTTLWSNQVNAMQKANGQDLKMVRLPSQDGTAKGAKLWFKSGQYLSINAKSKHPAEAAKFVDYFVNSPEAGKVLLAERGLPPNMDIQKEIEPLIGPADKKALAYLTSLTPDVTAPPVAPPSGVSTFQKMLDRYNQDVQFGRTTPAAAAKSLYDEAKSSIR